MWHLGSKEIEEINYPFVFFALLFTILSFLAVAGRVYTRLRISREIGWDDYFIVGAEFCHIVTQSCHLYQVSLGLGDPHIIDNTFFDWVQVNFLGTLYGGLVSYQLAQVLVKLSVIFQYRRLFTSWSAQKMTFYLLAWVVPYGLASVLLSILHCWPISNFWSTSLRTGCASLTAVSLFMTIANVVTNFAVWLFPLFYVVPLRVARQADKIRLLVLFASALMPEFFGIGRLSALVSFVQLGFDQQLVSRDSVNLNLMGSLEVSTAIIIASIPALMPLFRLASSLLASWRGRPVARPPPNPHSHNIQRTPTRSNGFSRHLEGLESGESILLDDYLPRPTPTRARAEQITTDRNTSPGRPPRTPVSQDADTILESPSPSLIPVAPMTSVVSDTPPRLEVGVDPTSFISDALPGLDVHVQVDRSSAVDADKGDDLDPKDLRLGSKTTITGGAAAK